MMSNYDAWQERIAFLRTLKKEGLLSAEQAELAAADHIDKLEALLKEVYKVMHPVYQHQWLVLDKVLRMWSELYGKEG